MIDSFLQMLEMLLLFQYLLKLVLVISLNFEIIAKVFNVC